ncbi:MAG: hypothetical protein EBZ77_06880 [Chitinophagia bacterium]|nr:hypothetical protein [Chitinophagia bacterium]
MKALHLLHANMGEQVIDMLDKGNPWHALLIQHYGELLDIVEKYADAGKKGFVLTQLQSLAFLQIWGYVQAFNKLSPYDTIILDDVAAQIQQAALKTANHE